MDTTITKQRLLPRHSHTRSGKEAGLRPASYDQQPVEKQPSSVVMDLDRDGMADLHEAFGKYHNLNEEDFVAEMLVGLKADKLSDSERVSTRLDIFAGLRI